MERRQNALLNSFPNLQNYGNFQTQFDFSINIEDNEKPEKIPNIDLQPTYNKFTNLQEFFKSSEILSEYINIKLLFNNDCPCPFKITMDSYRTYKRLE